MLFLQPDKHVNFTLAQHLSTKIKNCKYYNNCKLKLIILSPLESVLKFVPLPHHFV